MKNIFMVMLLLVSAGASAQVIDYSSSNTPPGWLYDSDCDCIWTESGTGDITIAGLEQINTVNEYCIGDGNIGYSVSGETISFANVYECGVTSIDYSTGATPQPPVSESGVPAPIIVMFGQSNMCGRGSPGQTVEDAFIYDNGWRILSGGTGPETALAIQTQERFGEVFVVKFCEDGSGLDLNADSAPEVWHPDGNALYDDLIAEVTQATNALTGRVPYFVAAVMMQGENDAIQQNSANNYAANLQALVTRLRQDLQPNLLFIYGRVAGWIDPGIYRYVSEVQAGQNPSLDRMYMITTDDLTDNGDGIHFDTGSLNELGNRFFGEF